MVDNSARETGLNLPKELAVWIAAAEEKKADARDLQDFVAQVLELIEIRERLELVTRDVVGQLNRYMLERQDLGFGEFVVKLPPGSYVVDALQDNVVEEDVQSYVATGVHWAGPGGAEFYNGPEGTKVQSRSLDFIIEPSVEPIVEPIED